jgi:HD-GYP domain-containing protein (c-di-GMP phosphodiesterase class II)
MNTPISGQKYTPVRITTIKSERAVTFPVYIHFKDHYLEYIKPETSLDKEKYKKLRKQKITKFFIQSQDEIKYQDFLDGFLQDTLNDPNATLEDKTEMVTGQSETAIEKMATDPGNENNFNMTRKAAKNLQKLVFENPDALKTMFNPAEDDGIVIQHSINVAILTIKFARKKKLDDEEIDYLSTAALMHDVALLDNDKLQEVFLTPRKEIDKNIKKEYYDHTRDIIPLLKDRPYINQPIIEFIEFHEENLQGSGPHKKKKLTLAQEILSMINAYDKILISKKLTPKEGIKAMMIDELGNYTLKLLNEFQNFLKEEGLIS